jgi:hypothetical protein
MRIARHKESELTYIGHLIEAGWRGALSIRGESGGRPSSSDVARGLLVPAAIGAALGALTAAFRKDRGPSPSPAATAFLGGAVGLGAGVAWASRGSAGAATHAAMRRINAVRDSRWLESHPIAYG